MGRDVSLGELRRRALDAADMKTLGTSQYNQIADVNFMLNDSVSELHDLLRTSFEDYFVKTLIVAYVAGHSEYDLPDDFFSLRGCNDLSNGYTLPMLPFTENDRPSLLNALQSGGPLRTRYCRVEDTKLVVLPAPTSGSMEVRYIYQAPYLSDDSDTLSYSIVNGWDAYIVYDTAAKLRMKAGKDASAQMAKVAQLQGRIRVSATQREAQGRSSARDVYGWSRLK